MQLAIRLRSQWAIHRAEYKAPPAGTIIPPAATMQYWMGIKAHAPDLSKYACFCLLRPNGNAAPERLMSLLTAMDKPSARTTKAQTLRQVLFLRGNAEIVRLLLHRGALLWVSCTERQRQEYLAGDRPAGKRLQATMAVLLQEAHAAGAAAGAAGAAAAAAAAAAKAAEEEEGGEEEEEEEEEE